MALTKNFIQVFAEGLTPAQRERVLALTAGDEIGLDVAAIWDLVLESHVGVLEPCYFVRAADKKLIRKEAFTSLFAPVVNALEDLPARYRDNPVKYAQATMRLLRASAATYEPGGKEWSGTQFNMWKDPGIEPLAERPALFRVRGN